jgi:hypothetical protein
MRNGLGHLVLVVSSRLPQVAQAVAVVTSIGKTSVRWRQRREQTVSWPVIADLPAGDGERDQTALGIGYAMDFGPRSAS